MPTRRGSSGWTRAFTLLFAACALAALGIAGTPARADGSQACPSSTDSAYSMELRALTGPQGADLRIGVRPAAGCAAVDALKKVQLKIFDADGSLADVRNLGDVNAPDGVADIDLGQLDRGRQVAAEVLVQTGVPKRTYVLRGEATTRLRPDLVVTTVHAPLQTLTTRPIDVQAEVSEVNGDTGADATVTLSWGDTVLATQTVTVPAGGQTPVTFAGVALTDAVPVELSVAVSDADPAETDPTNNSRTALVDVTELELASSRLLVSSLGGYGAQFNQHVFAAITGAPPGSLPDLEAKVKALEPQLVRIFYNVNQEADPDKMQSFVETVQLAQESGAAINITYQTAGAARLQPDPYMSRFAAILDDLVRTRGLTNVRWVTLQNEPNSSAITLPQYNALYRALNAQLVARGLRDQIGLMGGDLVEDGGGTVSDQRVWFHYMADHMNDILDAYSVHIYWNYWDIPRMEFRLKDVRQIVTEELPPDARKPTYITEFGVRGKSFPGKPDIKPLYWEDGTPIARTNIAAFQQLWFDIESAQLGYIGAVKWDAYWGKYDNGTQAHWLIGPASEGWPLFPAYHAMQLLLQTTQRGWEVLGVDPWTSDDWEVGVPDQPEKEVAAYAGPGGELTLIGLDSHGRDLNAVSSERPAYSVGGLPPFTTFNLAVWNLAGDGQNEIVVPVTANAAGVVRFEAPLHAAFALTTVPLS